MNKFQQKHCTDCGAPTIEVLQPRFDADTGEQFSISQCSVTQCHMDKHTIVPSQWWQQYSASCEVCGKKVYYDA